MKAIKLFGQFSIIVLSLTLTSSCNKLLDIKPTDVIDADKAIVSMDDLKQATVGVYSIMGNTNVSYRTAGNADIILSSLMSDENYLPVENITGNGVNTYKWLISADDQNTWANWGSSVVTSNPVVFTGSNYAVIDRANRVLRVIESISENSVGDKQDKARIKGELLALRAHCHFQILKSYAESYEPQAMGVPYMESINDAPGKVKPSRLTVAETFQKIERDLAEAKSLIPKTFTDVTRITSNAVSAIQARVFLYEKKWSNAVESSSEVIAAVPLVDTVQFKSMWSDASTAEVVWKLKKETDNDKIGLFYRTPTGVEYGAALKLVNAFDRNNDGRFSIYIESNNSRGINKAVNLVNKYNLNKTITGLADIKLYRVAEMYLIRAEAYAELSGSVANALTLGSHDLTTLRTIRMKHYTHIDYPTKDALISSVYTERFKELAFEGHRYFDLRRRNLDIDRKPIATDDNGGESIFLSPSKKEYFLPIPGFEMRANENMKQNPGYQ